MTRLGLWGGFEPFATYDYFNSFIEKMGVGGMELTAL